MYALILCLSLAGAQVDLPDDAGKNYTTVFDDSGKLAGWFQSDPALADLKARTHFNVIKSTDPTYARYAKYHKGKPTIVVQTAAGTPLYVGNPSTPQVFAKQVTKATCIFRRWQRSPGPTPVPGPQPSPDPTPTESSGPNVPWLWIGIGIVSLLVGAGYAYYEQYYKGEKV